MSNAKEIRTQIKSIKSTQKITKAMEMVAASKMKKANTKMLASRPYAQKITEVIDHVAASGMDYKHPYMVAQDSVKQVGFILVSTDRGLCGGLNINLFKKVMGSMHSFHQQNVEVSMGIFGKKGHVFFRRIDCEIAAYTHSLGDNPVLRDLLGVVRVFTERFIANEVQEVYLCHNSFINTMSQEPQIIKLLPIEEPKQAPKQHRWDYIYEPRADVLLDNLLERYIDSVVYQAVVESVACEQAARMVAMKSASDNAGDLIDEFQLAYNKARQSAITQELSEIVAGAAAV